MVMNGLIPKQQLSICVELLTPGTAQWSWLFK